MVTVPWCPSTGLSPGWKMSFCHLVFTTKKQGNMIRCEKQPDVQENPREVVSLDHHSTSKQKDVALMWMDQEEILVTEARQRTKHCLIPLS